jgi:pimeloyl-ACP methyl ester carboxylesterase
MTASTQVRTGTLKVPGATLYFEVRGSGPVLLMIPGGPADAGSFDDLASRLADRYTVVAYDTRGNSRSALDGPAEDVPVAVHADDAHRLLASLGEEPALIYGSSGGAVIGLELVTRHPEQVRTLVAHEPPAFEVLPDAAEWRAKIRDIAHAYQTGGAFGGMQTFGEYVEEGGPKYEPPSEPTPEDVASMTRMMGNFDFFLGHVIEAISGYTPDVETLKKAPTRIVIVGGENSGRQGARRAADALAGLLGTSVVSFPGGHGGFGSDPDELAAHLAAALSGDEA